MIKISQEAQKIESLDEYIKDTLRETDRGIIIFRLLVAIHHKIQNLDRYVKSKTVKTLLDNNKINIEKKKTIHLSDLDKYKITSSINGLTYDTLFVEKIRGEDKRATKINHLEEHFQHIFNLLY